MKKSKYINEKGQVLLVVVLVMVVALTVGLSMLSRSISNLRNATDEEHSQKAFSAAEAGIEQFLKNTCSQGGGCSLAQDLGNSSSFQATAQPVVGDEILLNGGNIVYKDDGVDLWLSDYSEIPSQIYQNPWSGSTITIHWGNPSIDKCQTAALEIIVLFGPKTAPTSKRFTADPCNPERRAENNFDPPASENKTISGVTFNYKTTLNIGVVDPAARALLARIVPLYGNAIIGVSGGGTAFPPQGSIITSTGSAGDTKRKISLVRGYPGVPSEFFQYILFQTK